MTEYGVDEPAWRRALARRLTAQACGPRFRRFWPFARLIVPKLDRLCFEGCPEREGQMWFAERRLLYGMLREHRPRVCVEIGTATGGGSTFFTALALSHNGLGVLHTYDVDRTLHEDTVSFYARRIPDLAARVAFHLADYRTFAENTPVDCLMLDGPEDARSTLEQLEFFEPRLSPDALVFAHDWNTEKARLVRPLLEESGRYRIAARLDAPASVGFVAAFRTVS